MNLPPNAEQTTVLFPAHLDPDQIARDVSEVLSMEGLETWELVQRLSDVFMHAVEDAAQYAARISMQ